jgi:hypothetical protein
MSWMVLFVSCDARGQFNLFLFRYVVLSGDLKESIRDVRGWGKKDKRRERVNSK